MCRQPPPDPGPQSSDALENLLARNRAWAQRKTEADPLFFSRLVGQQRPDYFWIGCSDSRVPATEIVDLDPGEMFVHRNVSNLALIRDPSFNAALLFAVDELRVGHVMVVGHYGCGGIRAAGNAVTNDAIGHWLAPIRSLSWQHRLELLALPDEASREDRLCELNVEAQVEQLSVHPVVTRAWQAGRRLSIHGLVYAIGDGLVKRVCQTISAAGDRQPHPAWDEDELDSNIL